MILEILSLSDAAITLIMSGLMGIASVGGVYVSLRLDIKELEVKQEESEKEIERLRADMKEVKGELKESINEVKDLLHTIKIDIEKIRR